MELNDIKTCLETLAEVIPQVSENSRQKLFNALAILKHEYSLQTTQLSQVIDVSNDSEKQVSAFKKSVSILDDKLKKLHYGARGYILVYTAAKDLLGIDVYQIRKQMEEKYSKNKATNLLRSLVLAGGSYLRDICDLTTTINENPEDYVHYLKLDSDDVAESHEVDISKRAENIITEQMVKDSVDHFRKHKENYGYNFFDDEIPF